MGITLDDRAITRAHRLGKPNPKTNDRMTKPHPRPIIVKLEHYKGKNMIWSQRTKLKGSGLYIEEDFPLEVDTQRRRLYPIMKAASELRNEDGTMPYKARLSIDKLIINSKTYSVDTLHTLPDNLQPEKLATKVIGNNYWFWSKDSPLSNHFIEPFQLQGKQYNCVEQYLV